MLVEFDVWFLASLFGAMLVSVAIFARGVSYLLEHYPIGIWSFFFGLVVASVFVVGRKLPLQRLEVGLAIGVGAGCALFVVQTVPIDASASPLSLFIGGCIAVCAWILPGLSGSFVLLILGLYETVIVAVRDFDLVVLGYVGLGCLVGIISFARVLSYLLERFHDVTVGVLVGFMLGSLMKLWPWKHTTSYQIKADGSQVPVVQEPVLPETFDLLTHQDPQTLLAVLSCLLGMVLIIALDRFALLSEQQSVDTPSTNRQKSDEAAQ